MKEKRTINGQFVALSLSTSVICISAGLAYAFATGGKSGHFEFAPNPLTTPHIVRTSGDAGSQVEYAQLESPVEEYASQIAKANPHGQKSSRAGALLAAASSIGTAPIPLNSHTIVDIAESAAPSVVNIEVVRRDERAVAAAMPFGMDPRNPLGGQFFLYNGRPFVPFTEPLVPMPKAAPGSKKPDAVGSGMVIREDGYILTNAHVVKGASEIRVNLNDKRSFPGKVIGTDSFSDLAVVKIDAQKLPAIKLGSSADLKPGEFVVAIGDPLSFDHTVTFGIISAVGRTITDVNGFINFIQTDAAINPGNSGGPLLNLKGEVIAINTAIDKVGQNIGFSIPVDVAKTVADDLINHKAISRPWIGIGVRPLTEAKIKALGLKPGDGGVSVEIVYETSPAQAAGLEPGDVILKVDNRAVSEGKMLQDIVRAHKVGEVLKVTYLRAGEEKTTDMTIGKYPDLGEPPKADKLPPEPKTEPKAEP
ncbi:MAG: trypsin-like peptidase domain-containing protein [Cyanobacteria bacterium SZAS TMP-1]|nr:trypsin-like peptidase domain-containing protein [Cyanobacteria bacterium SZAS TMP-1]